MSGIKGKPFVTEVKMSTFTLTVGSTGRKKTRLSSILAWTCLYIENVFQTFYTLLSIKLCFRVTKEFPLPVIKVEIKIEKTSYKGVEQKVKTIDEV